MRSWSFHNYPTLEYSSCQILRVPKTEDPPERTQVPVNRIERYYNGGTEEGDWKRTELSASSSGMAAH